MSVKGRWIAEAYFVLFVGLTVRKACNFFAPHSPSHLYFEFLYVFDPVFWGLYSLNLLQIVLNLLHALPLLLYIWRIPLLRPRFWRYLLILRLIFDITGHSYEMNHLVSMYHADPLLCLLVFLSSISPYIPSYVACWRYAFGTEAFGQIIEQGIDARKGDEDKDGGEKKPPDKRQGQRF